MLFLNGDSPGHASGRRLALLLLAAPSLLLLCQPALASDITVASPVNGTSVASPIWVRAHNVGCGGLSPTAFGYSIDNSSTLTRGITAYDIDVTNQAISAGSHTVHFKSWTSQGICPVVETTFTVSGGSITGPPLSTIPSYAAASGDLDGAGSWEYEHDAGTAGSSRGSTLYPATTPSYDDAREFYMTYSDHGGERYHLSFGANTSATHFAYDTYIYFVDPSQVENVEMDLNQVMANGETVIFGTQCSSISKTWEFVSVKNGDDHWNPSNIPCNPRSWIANTWHHIQIGFHRDSNGVVTHDWVTLDGTRSSFTNATGAAALKLGWALGDLLINFQLDGENAGSGSITSYIHKMTIYSWQ
jgi:hypothetical protein